MASGESSIMSGEKDVSEDTPDGYHASKTGPKGVLADYSLHQAELEEQRERKQREIREMMEKQVVNYKDEKASLDLGSQQFLEQYRAQKFMELKEQAMLEKRNFFGHLVEIRGDKYADTIDKESPDVFIIISIYEEHCQDSQLVNQCLTQLARSYPTVKFIRVQAHKVQMSSEFITHAVPTILVYKGGNLLGNFVKITETLRGGEKDFSTDDMESFLLEKNCLPSLGKIDFAPPLTELKHQSGN